MKAVAVIGCGNPNRSDDGAGPRVIEALRALALPSHVALFDAGTDGMDVMYRARGARRLIIVDARAPGGSPGAIYEAPGAALESVPARSLTLHDFRWDHALYAGRRIYGDAFPPEVSVILIEAGTLEYGLDLTPEVCEAVGKAARRIAELASAPLEGENQTTDRIDVRAGSVYFGADTANRYFKAAPAVAMTIRDGALCVFPVHKAQFGGCLLKIRNAAGDRVASAPDVFEAHGFGGYAANGLRARWSEEEGALIAPLSAETAN